MVDRVCFHGRLLLLAFGLLAAGPLSAAENALAGIQIVEQPEHIVLEVEFTVPMKYVKHFPPREGEILQIQLQALREKVMQRESLSPPSSDVVPLSLVTYEGDIPGGPYLTIRFNYGVAYTVEESPGGNSILILIKRDTLGTTIRGSGRDERLMSEKRLDDMMDEARQTLAKGDNGRAIQLFTQLLRLPVHKYTPESKELLGLARERKGQVARARIEYQEYLSLYPKGEGTQRVRQRLAALNQQLMQPRKRLKRQRDQRPKAELVTFGRLSQRYYSDTSEFKSYVNSSGVSFPARTSTRETLTSFINASTRYRTADYDIRGVFNLHDIQDLLDSTRNRTRLNNFYIDFRNTKDGYGIKAGRQSSTKGGVFGRFDGVWADYQLAPGYTLSVSGGKPVEFTSSDIIADKRFYGANLGMGTFAEHWDGNLYIVNQDVETMVDRRAVGGDIRYNDKTWSVYNAVDYDIVYEALNMYLFRGVMKYDRDLRLNLSYSHRLSPILFSTNALQQEGVLDFGQLLAIGGEAAVIDKARALSSISRTLTIGAVYQIDKDVQLNADVTRTVFTGKPQTTKILDPFGPPIPATGRNGPDYLYSAQVIASNYFLERDINILGLRYSDRETRDSVMVFYNNRFAWGKDWRIGPRIQREDAVITSNNSKLVRMNYVLKLDYRLLKKVSLEGEFGYETNRYSGGTNPDYDRFYFYVGYFWDF